jgi:hypothetical protein
VDNTAFAQLFDIIRGAVEAIAAEDRESFNKKRNVRSRGASSNHSAPRHKMLSAKFKPIRTLPVPKIFR